MSDNKVVLEIEFPPLLNQEETVSKAVGLFQDGNDVIIITNDQQKYLGLIRTRDVVGKGMNLDSLCKSYLVRVPPIIEDTTYDPIIVGEMMENSGSRYIPIVNKYSISKGAILDFKILNELRSSLEGLSHFEINDAINWDLVSLNENDSVGNALANLRSHGFSRIPVFGDNNEIMGIIRDRFFLTTQGKKRATVGDITGDRDKDWYLLPVKDFLQPMDLLSENNDVFEVIDRFINQGESALFFKSENEDYGIITPLDIIRYAIVDLTPEEIDIVVMQAPDDSIKSHTIRKGNSIVRRYKSWLGPQSSLTVRFKRNFSQSKRGQFSIKVTIRLSSNSGKKYNSESTNFGAEKAVNQALDNLSRIISSDRRKNLTKRDKGISLRKSSEYEI